MSDHDSGESGDRLQRTRDSAHEYVDRIADKAAAGAEQVAAVQEEWLENARTLVHENPLGSLVIGVAAGILLGRILDRR